MQISDENHFVDAKKSRQNWFFKKSIKTFSPSLSDHQNEYIEEAAAAIKMRANFHLHIESEMDKKRKKKKLFAHDDDIPKFNLFSLFRSFYLLATRVSSHTMRINL